MNQLPQTAGPLVIRTDYKNQPAWDAICALILAPVQKGREYFYAYVEFLEDAEFRNLSKEDLLARVPCDYHHPFLVVADCIAMCHPELAVLVVDLCVNRGRSFRAIPTAIQSVENNLSIANLHFSEFAEWVDEDGIFRDFPRPGFRHTERV